MQSQPEMGAQHLSIVEAKIGFLKSEFLSNLWEFLEITPSGNPKN